MCHGVENIDKLKVEHFVKKDDENRQISNWKKEIQ
jgi:hypothetical protein